MSGYVLMGMGGLGVGVGAVFSVLGLQNNERLLVGPFATPEELKLAEKDGQTDNAVALVGLVGGPLLAGLGAALAFLTPQDQASAPSVAAVPGGGAILVWSGRW